MSKLSPANLMTLEAYAKARPDLRTQVIAHKKTRTVCLGDNLTLIFEDETADFADLELRRNDF